MHEWPVLETRDVDLTMRVFDLISVLLITVGCNEELPQHVTDLIKQYESNPGPAPSEIWRYRFEGRTVYYIPPMPYDIPSTLFSADGDFICSPDGGLTGAGDGKCPTFFEERRGGEIVWRKR